MIEAYLEVLEEGYFEVQFAFEGLSDENVWKRPAVQQISIGELAAHIAYWEAVRMAGEHGEPLPDLTQCRVSSLLIDHRFRYPPMTIEQPPSPEHLAMTAEQVYRELMRVHNESVAYLKSLNPTPDSFHPGFPPSNTYGAIVKYAAFHVAYHTGQMYMIRHLFGEETPDN